MALPPIKEGFDVFLHDGDKAVGAVRRVSAHEIVIYIEDAGDFVVPVSAVAEVTEDKVVLNAGKLDRKLLESIRREHKDEDPRFG
jgi:hypothetical protein